MFCLFFTTPAEPKGKNPGKPRPAKVSRSRSIITWFLLVTWVILISFGIISISYPQWLEEASQIGKHRSSSTYKDYGDNYLRQRNYYMAIAQYEEALRIKPDNVGVLVNMAIVYSRMGDPARGLKMLNEALKIESPQKGNIYYNIAEILESQNKVDEAIRYYAMAEGSEFDQDLVYRKLGSIYYASLDLEKARDAFEKLLVIQNDPHTPYLNMLRRALAVYEDDTTHLEAVKDQITLAENAGNLDYYDLESIRSTLQHDREIAKTHNHLGAIYARVGDLGRAADHFRQSLQIWPGNTDAKRNLPLIMEALEKQAESESKGEL